MQSHQAFRPGKPVAPGPNGKADAVQSRIREISQLIAGNKLDEAQAEVDALLASHPNRHETHNLAGVLAVAQKRLARAMKHFEKTVELCPESAIYWQNLGKIYLDIDLLEKSLPAFGRALKLNPNLFEALWNAGELFRQIGRAETGLKYLDAALRLNPKHELALISKGKSLITLGRMAEAEALYRDAMKQGIADWKLYEPLSRIKKYAKDDPFKLELEQVLAAPKLSKSGAWAVRAALGKVHEDIGDVDGAFGYYQASNQLRDGLFDIEVFRRKIDRHIETYTPDFFARHAQSGSGDERPVFIVGMPRSGTTLTEQIVSAHPDAHGAGELSRIDKLAERLWYHSADGAKYFDVVPKMIPSDFAHLAGAFRGMMDFLAPKAKRVVDKMPHNFEHLGLIAIMFPKARIVHCTRNPIDTCLSCYVNNFNEFHSYSTDLHALGLYYREYIRLMEHWKKVLPIPIFEMRYEDTTGDLESQARKLIEFIGLPWDPACLKFNENKSTVQTLSNWQVRQPIYKTSVERWRKYEKHLKPLIEALGDLAGDAARRAVE